MTNQTPERPLNIFGAVDLSSLARPAAAPAGAAGSAAAPAGAPGSAAAGGSERIPGPYSVNLTEQSLPAAVETSKKVPVVVVVTSPRAQGSEQLADELVELARETQGRFQVGRVDGDSQASIVGAFGVQMIPSVLVILGGQPIPVFQGVAEKAQLREVIQQVLGAAAQNGIRGSVDGSGEAAEPEPKPLDPNVQAGIDAIEAGDLDAAEQHFEKAITENPRDAEAVAGLAQVRLLARLGSDADEAEHTGLRLYRIKLAAGKVTREELMDCLLVISSAPKALHTSAPMAAGSPIVRSSLPAREKLTVASVVPIMAESLLVPEAIAGGKPAR